MYGPVLSEEWSFVDVLHFHSYMAYVSLIINTTFFLLCKLDLRWAYVYCLTFSSITTSLLLKDNRLSKKERKKKNMFPLITLSNASSPGALGPSAGVWRVTVMRHS